MGRRIIDDTILLELLRAGKQQKQIAEHFKVSPVAVCKRLKRLIPPPNLDHLTEKRKEFVVRVAQGESRTSAVMHTFNCKDKNSGKVIASQLLSEPDINRGIKDVMDWAGLTRSYRARKLRTHVDHPDPNISLKALDQSWRLDGYVEKLITTRIDIGAVMTRHEETAKELQDIEDEIKKLEGMDPDAEID